MARSLDPAVQPIYALHARWLAEVLGSGDSLLTPGVAIWTAEHLDELEKYFIGRPDLTKDKRFLEKLHDQLAPASPGAVQLMAELHVVHFLIIWNGAISAAKKRSDLEAILSWMPTPSLVPDDVAAVMAPGFVHPGQWVMSRRDTQLTWLIRFARTWKSQSSDRQRTLVDKPWVLKAFAETIQTPTADSARLALLHLAHPDTFESIVSPNHKGLIVKRFADVAGDDEDIDRRLLVARAALAPQYGHAFGWYVDPLVHLWLKGQAWRTFLTWLQRFRATPDFDETERTFKIELAQRVRDARDLALADDDASFESLRHAFTGHLTSFHTHGRFLGWLEDDPAAGHRALRSLWAGESSPIERLRSFLDCIPMTGLGPIGERLNIGSFLLMAEDPTSLPPMTINAIRKAWNLTSWGRDADHLHPAQVYERGLAFLDELVRDSAEWPVPLRDRLDAQGALWELVKYKERPDSWPTDAWAEFVVWRNSVPSEVDDEEGDPDPPQAEGLPEPTGLPLVDHIAAAANDLHINRAVLDEIVELLEDKRQVVLYGPPGTGKTFLALRLAKAIVEDDPTRFAIVQFHPATSYEDFFEGLRPKLTEAGQVTYERRDGPLVAIANEAALHPDRRYVLVIDEINRANLPKVFGELLFLLEYRTESARTLYRPTEPFKLPSNLWFIGTMNTADRSVALIDAAMRRRFHFFPFFPHEGSMKGLLERWLEAGGGRLGVAAFLKAVNRDLLGLLGEHLLIGPSHFMKTDLSDRALERIWTYNVFPLIEEQIWGNQEEIDRWRWAPVRRRFDQALSGLVAPSASDEHRGEDDTDAVQPV